MNICKAEHKDLNEILQLQYLDYKTEAALIGTDDIPPLKQTIGDIITDYNHGIILKMISENNTIIGSIRARKSKGTVYVGKLMVNPYYRGNGYGTKLLKEVERYYPKKRYELFTSTRSINNIILYKKVGYKIFAQKVVNKKLTFVYMEKF